MQRRLHFYPLTTLNWTGMIGIVPRPLPSRTLSTAPRPTPCGRRQELTMMIPTESGGSSKISQAEAAIKSDVTNHKGLQNVQNDIYNTLRSADTTNGQLDRCQFRQDLSALNTQLHQDGILPQVDLQLAGNGNVALRGISGDGTADGNGRLCTNAHGDKFQYDSNGF